MIPLNITAQYLLDIVLDRRTPSPTKTIFLLHDNNGANKHVKKLADRLELGKHIHWHTSRHTFSSNLFGKAEDVIVDQMLGHLPPKDAIKRVHYDRTSFKRMPELYFRAIEHLEFVYRQGTDGRELIPSDELKKAYMP
jgi:site-specific recombinase XerC